MTCVVDRGAVIIAAGRAAGLDAVEAVDLAKRIDDWVEASLVDERTQKASLREAWATQESRIGAVAADRDFEQAERA